MARLNMTAAAPAHRLPDLPFDKGVLAPFLSAESFDFHHGKHHAGYVAKLNELLTGHAWASLPLDDLIVIAAGQPEATAIFNNAAQHWNHSLYWESLRAPGGPAVPAGLEQRLARCFGSTDAFKQAFVAAGMGQFGSGWVWVIEDGGDLRIVTTSNADTPLTKGHRALLVCDVWEHAYYIDHRNARQAFLRAFVDQIADWDAASRRLSVAPWAA